METTDQQNEREFKAIRLAFNSFLPSNGFNGNGNPIIFLHGLTSCKETWGNIPEIFSDATNRKSYAVDLRNHGESAWSDSFLLSDLIGDVVFFMESVHAEKAIVVGHSMGGTVALHMALRMPEKVELLIVEDMFVKYPPKHLLSLPLAYTQIAPMAVRLLPTDIDEEQASRFIMDYLYQSLPKEVAEGLRRTRMDRSTMALKRDSGGRFQLKANMPVLEKSLLSPDEALGHIRGTYEGPACFIYGKMSPFKVGNDSEEIKKYFPMAMIVGVDEAKHSIHTEHADEFLNTTLKYISSYTADGSDS